MREKNPVSELAGFPDTFIEREKERPTTGLPRCTKAIAKRGSRVEWSVKDGRRQRRETKAAKGKLGSALARGGRTNLWANGRVEGLGGGQQNLKGRRLCQKKTGKKNGGEEGRPGGKKIS